MIFYQKIVPGAGFEPYIYSLWGYRLNQVGLSWNKCEIRERFFV